MPLPAAPDAPAIESQATFPISTLQLVTRGDPAGGADALRFTLPLQNVGDLLFERGIDVCHETIRFWWNRFGPLFAADIRRQRVSAMRGFGHWRWHLDEVFVKINGETHYLWRPVDHEGEVLESHVTKARDKQAALRFMKKALKRHGEQWI